MNNQFQPNYAIPPADTLKEIMEGKGWTVTDLVNLSQLSDDVINEVLSASIEIDEPIAFQLEKALNISRAFWLNLEKNYRETIKRLEAKGTNLHREKDGIVYEID